MVVTVGVGEVVDGGVDGAVDGAVEVAVGVVVAAGVATVDGVVTGVGGVTEGGAVLTTTGVSAEAPAVMVTFCPLLAGAVITMGAFKAIHFLVAGSKRSVLLHPLTIHALMLKSGKN